MREKLTKNYHSFTNDMYLDYICMTNPNWILKNCYKWRCYMEAAIVSSSNWEITPSVLARESNVGVSFRNGMSAWWCWWKLTDHVEYLHSEVTNNSIESINMPMSRLGTVQNDFHTFKYFNMYLYIKFRTEIETTLTAKQIW